MTGPSKWITFDGTNVPSWEYEEEGGFKQTKNYLIYTPVYEEFYIAHYTQWGRAGGIFRDGWHSLEDEYIPKVTHYAELTVPEIKETYSGEKLF